jgi:DNA-binding transcriptional MocR family regulator
MDAATESDAGSALSRAADTTLTQQLSARFAERIRQRLLAPGTRLPSVRDCARRHRVSPYTVVAAYDQLLALGLVDARKQRGLLRPRAGPTTQPPSRTSERREAAGPRHPLPISATALIRGMFQPPGARPMPALGTLPADWLDLPLLAGALRKVSSGAQLGPLSLQYGDPGRRTASARALALKLADFGVSAAPEQIVTAVGATHALDIVTRTLLRAGDSVLVDEPGLVGGVRPPGRARPARAAGAARRGRSRPRRDGAPDRAQKPHERPRVYVTVSVLHNPTGASLSLQSAHRVLKLAQAHDLHIVEDDTYAHLAPAHLPRLSALDALERTIYISGFSKILVPNWRVGFPRRAGRAGRPLRRHQAAVDA